MVMARRFAAGGQDYPRLITTNGNSADGVARLVLVMVRCRCAAPPVPLPRVATWQGDCAGVQGHMIMQKYGYTGSALARSNEVILLS
jgi:hypothetical protein